MVFMENERCNCLIFLNANILLTHLICVKASMQSEAISHLSKELNSLNPVKDWEVFISERSDHFVDPKAPLVKAQDLKIEGSKDPLCQHIKEGTLLRNLPGMLRDRGYVAGHYVLTSSGFLHGFSSSAAVASGSSTRLSNTALASLENMFGSMSLLAERT
jgi:hypothetical protein